MIYKWRKTINKCQFSSNLVYTWSCRFLFLKNLSLHQLAICLFPLPLISASHTMTHLLPMIINHTVLMHQWQLHNLFVQIPGLAQLSIGTVKLLITCTRVYNQVSHNTCQVLSVKFLTKQIWVCQGCQSGYRCDLNGDPLPPPYYIIIGHLEW